LCVCVHRGECVCIMCVFVVLCNSGKNGGLELLMVTKLLE
jgi:hypothetical protein